MNFLETILKEKREFLNRHKREISQRKLISQIKPPLKKPQFKTILQKPGLHLICEIKRASPSKGNLRPDLDIVETALIYQNNGVELISVLTEEKFFKGSLDDLAKVRENTNLSILCKDFIISAYQIYEAKLFGADAVLLIAKILSKNKLKEFLILSKKLNLDAVVEIHNAGDLKKILGLEKYIEIIGINHRNLEDFSIDLKITKELLPKIPKGKIVIAESGVEKSQDIKYFKELGVNGVLIGESLMKSDNISAKLKEFIPSRR